MSNVVALYWMNLGLVYGWLARTVRATMLPQYKFNSGLCSLSPIPPLIGREGRKKPSLGSVSRSIDLLGLLALRPLDQAWQQYAKLIQAWKAKIYTAIRLEAKFWGETIYFSYESGIHSDHRIRTTLTLVDETPVAEVSRHRLSPNMISIVIPCASSRLMSQEGSMNAEVFKEF